MDHDNTSTTVEPEWKYALYLEDEDLLVAYCSDIDNFFADTPAITSHRKLTLRDAHPSSDRIRETLRRMAGNPVGNGEIRILSRYHETMGAYYISGIELASINPTIEAIADSCNISITCSLLDPPTPFEQKLWRMRREGRPEVCNAWKGLRASQLDAWIRVAQMYQLNNPASTSPPGSIFSLDGLGIENTQGIFCALGEAVNGPGGYFGSGLDSLADCLRGGFGASAPFSITWTGWTDLISTVGQSYCTALTEVLAAGSATVDPAF